MRDIIYSLKLSYRASRDSEGCLRLAGGPCSLEELAHFCEGRTNNVLIAGPLEISVTVYISKPQYYRATDHVWRSLCFVVV